MKYSQSLLEGRSRRNNERRDEKRAGNARAGAQTVDASERLLLHYLSTGLFTARQLQDRFATILTVRRFQQLVEFDLHLTLRNSLAASALSTKFSPSAYNGLEKWSRKRAIFVAYPRSEPRTASCNVGRTDCPRSVGMAAVLYSGTTQDETMLEE